MGKYFAVGLIYFDDRILTKIANMTSQSRNCVKSRFPLIVFAQEHQFARDDFFAFRTSNADLKILDP